MCFILIASEYNSFVIQSLNIFKYIEIDVSNIIEIYYTEFGKLDTKFNKKLNKLHQKFMNDSGFLNKSKRYHSRSCEVLLHYLSIIIHIINLFNAEYYERIIEIYEKLRDDVIVDLQNEDSYFK